MQLTVEAEQGLESDALAASSLHANLLLRLQTANELGYCLTHGFATAFLLVWNLPAVLLAVVPCGLALPVMLSRFHTLESEVAAQRAAQDASRQIVRGLMAGLPTCRASNVNDLSFGQFCERFDAHALALWRLRQGISSYTGAAQALACAVLAVAAVLLLFLRRDESEMDDGLASASELRKAAFVCIVLVSHHVHLRVPMRVAIPAMATWKCGVEADAEDEYHGNDNASTAPESYRSDTPPLSLRPAPEPAPEPEPEPIRSPTPPHPGVSRGDKQQPPSWENLTPEPEEAEPPCELGMQGPTQEPQ